MKPVCVGAEGAIGGDGDWVWGFNWYGGGAIGVWK